MALVSCFQAFNVGVPRGTNWGRVHTPFEEDRKTRNIVYKEVLVTVIEFIDMSIGISLTNASGCPCG